MAFNTDLEVNALVEVYTQIVKELKDTFASLGISLTQQPPKERIDGIEYTEFGEPLLPSDITLCSTQDLGRLYGVFTNYIAYIGPLVSFEDAQARIWKEIKDMIWSRVRRDCEGSKKDDKDDYARNDPRYVRSNAEHQKHLTLYETLSEKRKMYGDILKFISREISRRNLELEENRVLGNLPQRRDSSSNVTAPSRFNAGKIIERYKSRIDPETGEEDVSNLLPDAKRKGYDD